MRIIFKDLKKGIIKLKIENLNDLWYLNKILEPGDIIRGKAERKINLSDKDQKTSTKRIIATISIELERIEFHKYSDILRLTGKVKQGNDNIPNDVYQTINLEVNSVIEITKKRWLPFQIKYLNQALKTDNEVLAVILDREEAIFATISIQGFRILSRIKADVQKKDYKTKNNINLYDEIVKILTDYNNRFKPKSIIIASPAFWKDELKERINNNEIKKKLVTATCNHVGVSGLAEVLKREELKKALKDIRAAEEEVLINKLMTDIKDGNKTEYGFENVKKASDMGAVDTLLVTDNLLKEFRQNDYDKLEQLMANTEKAKGKIEIINSDTPAGKQLDGLGGIACFLRFEIG